VARPKKKSPWEKTAVQCLLRNRHSGKYYGRFTVSGKQKWVSLDTDVLTVAKLRLPDEAAKIEKTRGAEAHVEAGSGNVGELMEIYLARARENPDLKPATIVTRETAVKKVEKTWPGIKDLDPAKITAARVQDWAARFKRQGTGFVPPQAKKALKGNSASSVNRAIDVLRHVLDIAVERGQIHSNPVAVKPREGRLKKKVTPKKLILPTRAEAEEIIRQMRVSGEHGGWGAEAAFLCLFLMMTGARIGEIPHITWKCVRWTRKEIYLPGYKTETSDRIIPLFGELESVLKEIVAWRKAVARHRKDGQTFLGPTDSIFRIKECQKSIDAACAQTGVHRITHHDWRHLFATICIESGVDIPTVSRWLGHNDGGVLAMKTYGHLRRDHSQQAAQKVHFVKKI